MARFLLPLRGMTSKTRWFFALCVTAGAACGSSATDIGDITVGTTSYHISREGPEPAAGVATQMVIKPNDGSKPDMIAGWVGLANADASTKVAAKYDPNDGDFDDDITCPSPMPVGSKFHVDITTAGVVLSGSIDFK